MWSTPTSGKRLFCRRKGRSARIIRKIKRCRCRARRLSSVAPAAGLGVPGDAAARRLGKPMMTQARQTLKRAPRRASRRCPPLASLAVRPIDTTVGCVPPSTRRAVRSVSSSVVTSCADIVERGAVVLVERHPVSEPHPERELVILSEARRATGKIFFDDDLNSSNRPRERRDDLVVVGCSDGLLMFLSLSLKRPEYTSRFIRMALHPVQAPDTPSQDCPARRVSLPMRQGAAAETTRPCSRITRPPGALRRINRSQAALIALIRDSSVSGRPT